MPQLMGQSLNDYIIAIRERYSRMTGKPARSLLHPGHHCISTAGARANPAWLDALLATDRLIYCGYDNDATGENAAQTMITSHPTIRRHRPVRHDWNEDLKNQL